MALVCADQATAALGSIVRELPGAIEFESDP
jgi:hypothetical protein